VRSSSALSRIELAALLAMLCAGLLGAGGVPQGETPAQHPQTVAPGKRAGPKHGDRPRSADRVMASVQKRYARVRDLRASFVQESHVASLGREDTSTGTVLVKRPGRMRWEYVTPEPRVLAIDSQTVRLYTPLEHQLQVAPLDPKTFSPTALTFLLGEGDLRQSFAAEPLVDAKRKEIGIRLRPKSDASFEYLDLWLARRNLQIRESVVVDLFGNRTAVRFSEVAENSELADSAFALEVPAETEIIDLR
jgi:outer membrane lipoprotein carrier protein